MMDSHIKVREARGTPDMQFALLLITCVGVAHCAPAKLPESFMRCKRGDPKVDECLQEAIQHAIPELVKGVPGLGLLTIDPLSVTELVIDHGGGPVAVDLVFRDLKIGGFRNAKITKLTSDIDNYKMKIGVELSEPITLQGLYEVSGKVLVLPITGKGNALISLDNLQSELTITGKEVKKNGVAHMEMVDFDVKFTTSRLHMKLDNLFNGDKALGDNMNVFLNENWREILMELKPSFESALGATFKQIASRLYSKVPYKDIYL